MDAIKKGLREVSFAYKKKCLDTICANTSTPLCASFRTPLRARRSRLPLDQGYNADNSVFRSGLNLYLMTDMMFKRKVSV